MEESQGKVRGESLKVKVERLKVRVED